MLNDRAIATTLTLESRGLVVALRVELPGNTVPFVDETGRFDLQTAAEETLPAALAKEAPVVLHQILESVEKSLHGRMDADVSSVALKFELREKCQNDSTGNESASEASTPQAFAGCTNEEELTAARLRRAPYTGRFHLCFCGATAKDECTCTAWAEDMADLKRISDAEAYKRFVPKTPIR